MFQDAPILKEVHRMTWAMTSDEMGRTFLPAPAPSSQSVGQIDFIDVLLLKVRPRETLEEADDLNTYWPGSQETSRAYRSCHIPTISPSGQLSGPGRSSTARHPVYRAWIPLCLGNRGDLGIPGHGEYTRLQGDLGQDPPDWQI